MDFGDLDPRMVEQFLSDDGRVLRYRGLVVRVFGDHPMQTVDFDGDGRWALLLMSSGLRFHLAAPASEAPQLLGLHDDPHAPDPPSCGPVNPGEDMDRVKLLWSERLEPMVRALVDDLNAPPDALLMPAEAMAGTRVATASVQVPPLAAVCRRPWIRGTVAARAGRAR